MKITDSGIFHLLEDNMYVYSTYERKKSRYLLIFAKAADKVNVESSITLAEHYFTLQFIITRTALLSVNVFERYGK